MNLLVYNAAVLRGRWSGVEWAVWQRAVELSAGKSPEEFVFLVADGVALPAPLPGGRVVRLPRFAGTRLGRILFELLLMPRLVRSLSRSESAAGSRKAEKRVNHLPSPISHLLSPICAAGGREEAGDAAGRFFAPAYVAPPRLSCPVTLVLYDLHVFTHPQFCTRLNRLHYRWRIPASLRRADVVEVPSHHVLEQLRRLFPEAAGKAVVRPLALRERYGRPVTDAEKAAVRDKYGLLPRYLLFVGDPAPRKNLPAALEAWRALRADGEDIGFVIAGSPAARTQIGQPAPRQGLTPPPPVALGYVPDEEMPALYAGAAALLYPSFDEGYGLPIAEARACGCPVVTSAPTAREIAPDAFLCGAGAAAVTAALRAALGRVP